MPLDGFVAQLLIVLKQGLALDAIGESVAEDVDVDAEYNDYDYSDSKWNFACLADSTAQPLL